MRRPSFWKGFHGRPAVLERQLEEIYELKTLGEFREYVESGYVPDISVPILRAIDDLCLPQHKREKLGPREGGREPNGNVDYSSRGRMLSLRKSSLLDTHVLARLTVRLQKIADYKMRVRPESMDLVRLLVARELEVRTHGERRK